MPNIELWLSANIIFYITWDAGVADWRLRWSGLDTAGLVAERPTPAWTRGLIPRSCEDVVEFSWESSGRRPVSSAMVHAGNCAILALRRLGNPWNDVDELPRLMVFDFFGTKNLHPHRDRAGQSKSCAHLISTQAIRRAKCPNLQQNNCSDPKDVRNINVHTNHQIMKGPLCQKHVFLTTAS
jgi:hypothetical protein